MDITLKPELEQLIAADVKEGRSCDPGEFVSKAVYHYIVARDLGEEYTAEEIDRLIAEGLRDIDAGDTIEGTEAFRQLRAHSLDRRQKQA